MKNVSRGPRALRSRESIDSNRSTIYYKLLYTLQAEEEEDSHFNPLHRAAKATLTVTVEDVNDNPPIFTQHSYLGHVTEHEKPGTEVTVVKAIDRDEVISNFQAGTKRCLNIRLTFIT